MLLEIKNKVEKELSNYIRGIDKLYSLGKISPILSKNIKNFISRKGKRVRPVLFIIGYLGFAKKAACGLYRSSVALEIFHDFMLIHDDIIDKSEVRRGEPSMHAMLRKYLSGYKNIKIKGDDLALVIGDIMYSMAISAFLSVKEEMRRKESALKKLIEAGIYTGSGEFIELLYGLKDVDEITKDEIYKTYDLKTANYTFASPLCMGAILSGAGKRQVNKIFQYGLYLGRSFQIKDDILGLFSEETDIGKSNLTDLQEAKKTILVWYAYNKSGRKDRLSIKRILSKQEVDKRDLREMRTIVTLSGALDYAKGEINKLLDKADSIIKSSGMFAEYKKMLWEYSRGLLSL